MINPIRICHTPKGESRHGNAVDYKQACELLTFSFATIGLPGEMIFSKKVISKEARIFVFCSYEFDAAAQLMSEDSLERAKAKGNARQNIKKL